jgi:hypothetical protein
MKIVVLKHILTLIVIFFFLGCQKDDSAIDERILPYFQKFMSEGSLRGKTMTLDNLTGHIVEIAGSSIVAQCTQYTLLSPMISQ